MAEVVIYTKTYCPFSQKCKEFLKEKNVEFDEKLVDGDPLTLAEMKIKSGERVDTPQIFINGHHIGNYDDLKTLEAGGKLGKLLK
ncbi:glutaredoxin 3 [Candidatus Peregrinibacteria bacterium]|nr:glutaredoxin 3 [Candidatus Peregrinibacteria bacterium]